MLRFVILGCGRITTRHADSLSHIEGISLDAFVDSDHSRAKQFAIEYGGKSFSSLDELIDWGQFDVACVCTPSGNHAEHAIALMNAGKHVVVEKPMALLLEDADAMIAASKKNLVNLFVVKQNRFNMPVQAVRRAFTEGRFGKMVLGTVRVRWRRDQSYYDQAPWRGKWLSDGGVFSNQASHHIDLLEWFMGDVESVFARTATQLVNIECEDTGIATLKFKSGALGVIEATTATRPVDLEGSISLLGETGSAEISGFAMNKIRHFNFTQRQGQDAEVMSKYSDAPTNVYGFGHLAYLQNVVDCLRGNAASVVDGLDGRRSLELIHALYCSAEAGKEITLGPSMPKSRLGR